MKANYSTIDYLFSGSLAAVIPALITLFTPMNLGFVEAPILTLGLVYILTPLVNMLRLSASSSINE